MRTFHRSFRLLNLLAIPALNLLALPALNLLALPALLSHLYLPFFASTICHENVFIKLTASSLLADTGVFCLGAFGH